MAANDTTPFNSFNKETVLGEPVRLTRGGVLSPRISAEETGSLKTDDLLMVSRAGVGMNDDRDEGQAHTAALDRGPRASDDADPDVSAMFVRLGLRLGICMMGIVFAAANGNSSRRSGYPSPGSAEYTRQVVRDYARFQQHLADHPEIVREIEERHQEWLQRERSRVEKQATRAPHGEKAVEH